MGSVGRSQESPPPLRSLALGLANEGVAAASTPAEGGGQVIDLSRMPTDPVAQGLAENVEILDGAEALQ